jgi:hypothetical protein
LNEGVGAGRRYLLAGALWLLVAGCFDPDLSSDIPCAADRERCPSAMECIDGFCRSGSGSAHDAQPKPSIDASDPSDAAARLDAGRPTPDAAPVVDCHPLSHEGCVEPRSRCAFITTSTLPPYEGSFGCVEPIGNQQLGELCDYAIAEGATLYDDCRSGLMCGPEFTCQRVCEFGQDDSCDGDPSLCEPAAMLAPDVDPFGICAPDL